MRLEPQVDASTETAEAAPAEPAAGAPGDQQHLESGPRVPMVPESPKYRLKKRLLGPPLSTETLDDQRLGKPTALAGFALDNLSSAAHATEEILRVLVPVIGIAAFSLVVPVTGALLIVLAFLILSYRQTIRAYPSAGGAHVCTKDKRGTAPSLV